MKYTLIFILLLFSTFFGTQTIADVPQNELTVTTQSTKALDYNYYTWIRSTNELYFNHRLDWSFTGTNKNVGIKVYIMTDTEYQNFKDGKTFDAILVSDGSYYSASGEYLIDDIDQYYVVFWNVDSDQLTTTLTYDVKITNIGSFGITLDQNSYDSGDNMKITWQYNFDTEINYNQEIQIELWSNDGTSLKKILIITDQTKNDGSYTWKITNDIEYLESMTYLIVLRSLKYPRNSFGVSGEVNIKNSSSLGSVLILISLIAIIGGGAYIMMNKKQKTGSTQPMTYNSVVQPHGTVKNSYVPPQNVPPQQNTADNYGSTQQPKAPPIVNPSPLVEAYCETCGSSLTTKVCIKCGMTNE